MAEKLSKAGPSKIVITGITQGQYVANFCHEAGKSSRVLRTHRIGTSRSGTGDIFTAIIAADAAAHTLLFIVNFSPLVFFFFYRACPEACSLKLTTAVQKQTSLLTVRSLLA